LKFGLAQQKDQSIKRSRFSEGQAIGILKEHEAGVSVTDLCRKHGVSDASVYKWKAKYGGMDVCEAKRLRMLEEENTRLKLLSHDGSIRVRASRRSRSSGADEGIAHERRRFGYRHVHVLLKREGSLVNHKTLFRLYREEKLAVRRRRSRKRAIGTRAPMMTPLAPNERWSLDFVSDQLTDGRRSRILAIVDDCTSECLALVGDTSLSGLRVARELDRLSLLAAAGRR
jgi:putative transposase